MLKFNQDHFQIDGVRRMMFSGEFHYFRVPKADWRKRLRLWKAAGGTTIATYVPWLIHEPQEGCFDFDLLREFLKVVAEEKIGLIVRPGPYQYSELVNDGLPDWLLKSYPQILARDKQGRPFRSSSVSYQHPLFMEKVKNYFAQVCPILSDFVQSKGGPIVCTQADNELFGIHVWFGGVDYNPETFGFGREDGRYAKYLRKRFKSVATLNQRYGTAHRRFGEFTLADEPAGGVPAFLWNRDYFDFYTTQGIEYLETLFAMMRKYGLDGPTCHNSATPSMNAWFQGANEHLGKDFLLGSDHYYCLDQKWPQNNPTPQYFVRMFTSCEELRLLGNPPTVLEFPFGSYSDFLSPTAQDMTAALYLHLAVGMKGINGYVLTGGPNVPGTGANTDLYDYNAPISATGEKRQTYFALKHFGEFLSTHPDFVDARPSVDFQILMPWRAARGNAPALPSLQLPGALQPWELWENTLQMGLLTTAFADGMLPHFVKDLASATKAKPLVVPCDGTMAKAEQKALLEYVKSGGKVLCFPLLPQFNEDYQPCTLLADALGFTTEGMINQERERPRINVGPMVNVCCNHGWARASALPANAEILGYEEHSDAAVCVQRTLGKGMFIWLGMSWIYTNREQHQMLAWLLEQLGMKRHLTKDDNVVFCTICGKYLFACNLTTSPRKVNLTLHDGRQLALRLPPMKVAVEMI
ncbi:MAG: beta-galactosidase [Victivallales bacterium]|nr:beta-galactosidase [Victivallales bacterium]